MKHLLISAIFFLAVFSVSAQNNFYPGYIITLEQDTVQGLIDLRTDKINANHCVFKTDADASPVTYYPVDIRGYRFANDGKLYVSRTVELKRDSSVQLFLECMFMGVKNLYYYESDDNEEIYFIESHGRLVKLDSPTIESMANDGRTFAKEVNRYIPTLHYVFQDCPGIQNMIDHTPFTHKGMVDLLKTYHGMMCSSKEDCVEFTGKDDKPKIHVAITPYVGLQQYTSLGYLKEYGDPELTYLVGVNAAFSCPRLISSLCFVIDLSLSEMSMNDTAMRTTYSSMLLSGKLGGCYTYPKGAVRPFIGCGAAVSVFLSAKYKMGSTQLEPFSGAFSGYYANVGLQIPVTKKWQHAIMVRAQFEGTRDTMMKCNVFTGWSGAVGYTF